MPLAPHARQILIAAGIGALITLVLASGYIAHRLSQYKLYTESMLENIAGSYLKAAVSADRTEVTEQSQEAVSDCASRGTFDELLSRLQSLSASERKELDVLFPQCADYYYRLKLFHIDHLNTLLREYTLTLEHRDHIYAEDDHFAEVRRDMEAIIRGEEERKTAMQEQISVQRDIIEAMKQGSMDDPALTDRIGVVSAELGTADAAVDSARAQLSKALEGE